MSLRLVVDVNLSPAWVDALTDAGWDVVHWTTVGDPRAPDQEIMAWAREHGRVVYTHDLDFGTLLALTGACALRASPPNAPARPPVCGAAPRERLTPRGTVSV